MRGRVRACEGFRARETLAIATRATLLFKLRVSRAELEGVRSSRRRYVQPAASTPGKLRTATAKQRAATKSLSSAPRPRHGAFPVRARRPSHPRVRPRSHVPDQVRARHHDGGDAVSCELRAYAALESTHARSDATQNRWLGRKAPERTFVARGTTCLLRAVTCAGRPPRAQRHEEPVCVRDAELS